MALFLQHTSYSASTAIFYDEKLRLTRFPLPGSIHGQRQMEDGCSTLLPILEALPSVVNTSTPFLSSPPISLTILTNSSSEDANSPFAPMIHSPSFPPLLLLLTTNYNTVLISLNATWLHDLLETGFPLELTRMLLGNLFIDVQGRLPCHPALTPVSYWDGSGMGPRSVTYSTSSFTAPASYPFPHPPYRLSLSSHLTPSSRQQTCPFLGPVQKPSQHPIPTRKRIGRLPCFPRPSHHCSRRFTTQRNSMLLRAPSHTGASRTCATSALRTCGGHSNQSSAKPCPPAPRPPVPPLTKARTKMKTTIKF
jgi:hypothetical protein